MTSGFQTTNLHDAVTYHKLTELQGRAWCFSEDVRRKMASQLAKLYPQNGCGVCSAEMKLVAYVMPGGRFRMLVAPFKRIPIYAIANKPRETECPCANFFDPEVKGPWSERGAGKHHPMCQFQRGAQQVFEEVAKAKGTAPVYIDGKGVARREQRGQRVRPDLMIRVQREVLSR